MLGQQLYGFLEHLLWSAAGIGVWAALRSQLRATARLHATQAAREQARRNGVAARLRAQLSRVDAALLHATLARAHDIWLHGGDAAHAEALIDRLAAYLRAAQPGPQAPTVAHEAALLVSYAELRAALHDDGSAVRLDAAAGTAGVRVPPLLLQRLVERLLARGGTVGIDVRRDGDALRLALNGPGETAALPDGTAEQLALLYGEHASARVEGGTIVLRIPHEPPGRFQDETRSAQRGG